MNGGAHAGPSAMLMIMLGGHDIEEMRLTMPPPPPPPPSLDLRPAYTHEARIRSHMFSLHACISPGCVCELLRPAGRRSG